MLHLVYLHGFLSSPLSHKAQITKQWLDSHRAQHQFYCPFLDSRPTIAKKQLDDFVRDMDLANTRYIGSSLGGFWATYLVEAHGGKACLINPAVHPYTRVAEFLGCELKNYHTDDTYRLTDADMALLRHIEPQELKDPRRYQVLLQTQDEVIDYRLAERYFRHSQLVVEQGGDHAFKGYERWLPNIVGFLE